MRAVNKNSIVLAMIIMVFLFYATSYSKEKSKGKNKIRATTQYFEVYDPWEKMNKRVYIFNYYAEKYLILPIVDTYKFVTPAPIEEGVSNFFKNSGNVRTMVNSGLQGKGKKFMETLGRFSMNSIIGLFGTVDVATSLEMPYHYEDFGTTLAHYGVPNGPYLVLPLLGPSNVKNAVAQGVDAVATGPIHPYTAAKAINMSQPEVIALGGIDTRGNLDFRYYRTGTPFEYEYVRFIYTKYREYLERE